MGYDLRVSLPAQGAVLFAAGPPAHRGPVAALRAAGRRGHLRELVTSAPVSDRSPKPKFKPKPAARPFDLTITAAAGKPLVSYLRRHLTAAHAVLRPPLAELSVALVGDAAMAGLHERFMGIPGPTDVLTFPLDADARGRVTAGEVVVCVPEARRRSRAEGTTVEREVLLYALHGMLHLSGYDDLTPADYSRMHRAEDRVLTRIGVGAVFAGPAGAAAFADKAGKRAVKPRAGGGRPRS
ncbi:MAG: putative rRNA maturation factor [Phycisphaerales bacterium]|nr:putative rRNA maturation factor [Phycisphaerales bacterium]